MHGTHWCILFTEEKSTTVAKKKKKEREKCWKVKTHTHKHESKHSQIESNGKSLLTSIEIAIENSTT